MKRVISISAAARSHPYSIALRHTQRLALMADENWKRGDYYGGVPPHVGMKIAREIATISYRSGPEWEKRFGRRRANPNAPPALCPDFLIETYLDHQGERWCLHYDPNSFLYISKAMDLFDLTEGVPLDPNLYPSSSSSTSCALPPNPSSSSVSSSSLNSSSSLSISSVSSSISRSMMNKSSSEIPLPSPITSITQPILVLGVRSDILFPVAQQQELADLLKKGGNSHVTFIEVGGDFGHDTFLIDEVNIGGAIKRFMQQEEEET